MPDDTEAETKPRTDQQIPPWEKPESEWTPQEAEFMADQEAMNNLDKNGQSQMDPGEFDSLADPDGVEDDEEDDFDDEDFDEDSATLGYDDEREDEERADGYPIDEETGYVACECTPSPCRHNNPRPDGAPDIPL